MVNLELIAKWIGIGLGVLISGEASALFIGIYFVAEKGSSWLNPKNLLFLASDFVTGIFLIAIIVSTKLNIFALLFTFLAIIIGSHLLREIEYFIPFKNLEKFCFNLPLFIVNNFKMLIPIILFIMRPF